MDTLPDYSPYRLADPTVSRLNRTTIEQTLGVNEHTLWLHSIPCMPLPVIEPMAAYMETPRTVGLFLLPFVYLPDEIWVRYPHESYGAYMMRIMIALDALGLLQVDEQGVWFQPVEHAPQTVEQAASFAAAHDHTQSNSTYDQIRTNIQTIADQLWPGGYPLDEQLEFSTQLVNLSMQASPILAAQRALALLTADDPKVKQHSLDVIKTAREDYGSLFTEATTPNDVHEWMNTHKNIAINMIEQLITIGLEPESSRQTIQGLFS